jgi:hypothetical protein
MVAQDRQELTQCQIDGLKRRVVTDEDDYVEFEQKVGDIQVWCWLNEQKIWINGDDAITGEQALKLAAVFKEVYEFMVYGPGEWIDSSMGRQWQSALDEDGNDRKVPPA